MPKSPFLTNHAALCRIGQNPQCFVADKTHSALSQRTNRLVFCLRGQNPYYFVTRPRQPDQTRIYSGPSALCNRLMSIELPFDFPSIPKLPRVQDFLRTSYPSVFHFGTYLSPVLSNKSTSLVLVPSTTAVLSCEAGVTTCPRHTLPDQATAFLTESIDQIKPICALGRESEVLQKSQYLA